MPCNESDHSEIPTADVLTVTYDHDSSDAVSLLASSESVTLSPPAVEVEASSPEILAFISNCSSGAEQLEDMQDKLERDGLGENPEILLCASQNITDDHDDLEEGEQDAGEGSGEASGEEVKPNPTLSSSDGEDGGDSSLESDVKITLIPQLTLTPGWEPEPSTSTPQESRSDREYSAEPPVHQDSDDVTNEQDIHTEDTTGEFKHKKKLDCPVLVFYQVLNRLHRSHIRGRRREQRHRRTASENVHMEAGRRGNHQPDAQHRRRRSHREPRGPTDRHGCC